MRRGVGVNRGRSASPRSPAPGAPLPPRVGAVVLVALPWAKLEHPSIQLGLLHARLRAAGIPTVSLHLYVAFLDHLIATLGDPVRTIAEYAEVAAHHYLGDWVFAIPPFHDTGATDGDYFSYLRSLGTPSTLLDALPVFRKLAGSFVHTSVTEILRHDPRVVGFTTTLGQNVASLVVAQRLKRARPDVRIVFGGANCEGPMGAALHRCFPWIDVVVSGEAEPVLLPLVTDLLAQRPVRPLRGLTVRADDGKSVQGAAAPPPGQRSLDDAPLPVYDDYFRRLDGSPARAVLSPQVSLPIETSRGCWWGEKQHCTFCGLNGATMTYRRKSPVQALAELTALAARHQRLQFHAVDNILDFRSFDTLLPSLRDAGIDVRLFFETKANLTKEQVRILAAAGITEIQPGLESLSTPILQLVRKGVTALQNIRLLKWCTELGVHVYWNIIYGIPGEPPAEYERMATLARALTHLTPPSLVQLSLERFSPYFADPTAFGLEALGPTPHYAFTYPCSPDDLRDLAYCYAYRHADGRNPDVYVQPLRAAILSWQEHAPRSVLAYRRGPDFLLLTDRRADRQAADYRLDAVEAGIYRACDQGATVPAIHEALRTAGHDRSSASIERFLGDLCDAALLYEEDSCFLALATHAT